MKINTSKKYLVGWIASRAVYDKEHFVEPMTLQEAFRESIEMRTKTV